MTQTHSLYRCLVMHKRFAPKVHEFRYRVFSMLLDLDDLGSADQAGGWMFGVNRSALLSFHDKDHGPGDGTPAGDWARALLKEAETAWDGTRLQLLCFPRMWGYVFNPLAIYYARNADGGLAAILYQVSNTFGERHSYILASDGTPIARHSIDKGFHVSPFMDMEQRYDFSLKAPGKQLSIVIDEFGPDGKTLVATQTGTALPFTKRAMAKLVARHPLMTLKVMAAIHYEALHLWRKGIRFYKKPAPPEDTYTDATTGGPTLATQQEKAA
ncbi:MAG: DUF1365 domain-containing protein [Pseudomonadota bacterium]